MVGQSGPLQHGAPPLLINRYLLDLLLEGGGAHREHTNSGSWCEATVKDG